MALEIERKFLIRDIPEDVKSSAPNRSILQGYLITEGSEELRIRQKGKYFFITSKSGSGLVRNESELPISEQQFNLMWPFTENKRVIKTRYTLQEGDLTLELDEYHGSLEPLATLEVEFKSEEEAKRFTPPSYVLKDITEDNRYKNAQLARNGIPD